MAACGTDQRIGHLRELDENRVVRPSSSHPRGLHPEMVGDIGFRRERHLEVVGRRRERGGALGRGCVGMAQACTAGGGGSSLPSPLPEHSAGRCVRGVEHDRRRLRRRTVRDDDRHLRGNAVMPGGIPRVRLERV